MSTKTFLVAVLTALISQSVLAAQPELTRQFGSWGAYTFEPSGDARCYVLSMPTSMRPTNVDHGENYFLVAPQSKSARDDMPEAIMGYALKPESTIKVVIGDQTFRMLTRDNRAWLKRREREPELVAAMKSGDTMALHAISRRGTSTSYTYSLDGISAALKYAHRCH
jgi:hypothetical protein